MGRGRQVAGVALSPLLWLTLAVPSPATEGGDGVVRAVLFISPTCPHCRKVREDVLPPLWKRFEGRLQVGVVSTATPIGRDLYWAAYQRFAVRQQGVPLLVVGDFALVGSDEIPRRLPDLVAGYLAEGGSGWPDIPGLADLAAASTAPPPSVPSAATAAADSPPQAPRPTPVTTRPAVPEPVPAPVATPESSPTPVPLPASLPLPTPTPLPAHQQPPTRVSPSAPTRPPATASTPESSGSRVATSRPRPAPAPPRPTAVAPPPATVFAAAAESGAGEPPPATASAATLLGLITLGAGPEPGLFERLLADPRGNGLAILVLTGMVAAALRSVVVLRKWRPAARTGHFDWANPLLALAGLSVAAYLAHVEVRGIEAVCGPVGDCNTVQQSQYAHLFGVLPIGVLGVLGFGAIFTTWCVRRFGTGHTSSCAAAALLAMTGLGTLFSIYLTFLEPFVIGATCLWCLSSAVIMTALYSLTLAPACAPAGIRRRPAPGALATDRMSASRGGPRRRPPERA